MASLAEQRNAGTKEAVYDSVEIPEALGPMEFVLDDYMVKKFAFTQDDYRSWHFDKSTSPFGERIGHAAVIANDILNVYYSNYDRHSVVGLHAEEELWFDNPIVVGERVTLTGQYVEKYVKRGQGYVVMEAKAVGEDGRTLLRHRGVEILRTQPGSVAGRGSAPQPTRKVTGEYRKDIPSAPKAMRGLEPGTPIESLVKTARQDQMSVFSFAGEYQRNIHNDLEIAQKGGLALPIMQGQQEACYVAECLTSFFGAAWFTSGWQRVKFLKTVSPGDVLTIRGVVVGEKEVEEEEGVRLDLDVWIQNQAGDMTLVGWASALAGSV